MTGNKVIAVVGVGPGLGASVARRFAREGFAVALLARTPKATEPVAEQIREAGGRALPIQVDIGEQASVKAAFEKVRAELGAPEVLVHNAGIFQMGAVLDIRPEDLELGWRVSVLGVLLGAQEVLPDMIAAGRGTLIYTGATASLRGGAKFASLASAKFGQRALVQSMARAYGPQGVHVAHVLIDGQISTAQVRQMMPGRDPSTLLSPKAIAESYWQLHVQPQTAWTQELDLRPSTESF